MQILFKSDLPVMMSGQLEQVFFANPAQAQFRDPIRRTVSAYGVPELVHFGDRVTLVTHGSAWAKPLFALDAVRPGCLLGVVVFGRPVEEEVLIIHVALDKVHFLIADEGLRSDMVFSVFLAAVQDLMRGWDGVRRVRFAYWNSVIRLN